MGVPKIWTLEIGVYSAVTEFNEGCQGIHKVIEYMGFDTGSRLITKSVPLMKWLRNVVKKEKAEKSSERNQKRTSA